MTAYEEDRIPVATDRRRRAARPPVARHDISAASQAGLTNLFVIAACTAGGYLLGGLVGLAIPGGMLGLLAGAGLGLAALAIRFPR